MITLKNTGEARKKEIDNLKEKIKEQVEEIKLELENSNEQIESIEELSPKSLVGRVKNKSDFCNLTTSVMAYSDIYRSYSITTLSNCAGFYASAIGPNAMVSGIAQVSVACGNGGVPRKKNEEKKIENEEFNEEIEKREELRELRETIKNKCETIKGYVDEIIKISKENQIKNINDDNVKVIKSNGLTVVCTGFGDAYGEGDYYSQTSSGVENYDDIAVAISEAEACGCWFAMVYGYACLDCECEDCTNIPE